MKTINWLSLIHIRHCHGNIPHCVVPRDRVFSLWGDGVVEVSCCCCSHSFSSLFCLSSQLDSIIKLEGSIWAYLLKETRISTWWVSTGAKRSWLWSSKRGKFTELPMHFLEVLTTEEHYKHKILPEVRGGSRRSKKMLNAGSVSLLAKFFEVSQNAFGSCKWRETC